MFFCVIWESTEKQKKIASIWLQIRILQVKIHRNSYFCLFFTWNFDPSGASKTQISFESVNFVLLLTTNFFKLYCSIQSSAKVEILSKKWTKICILMYFEPPISNLKSDLRYPFSFSCIFQKITVNCVIFLNKF